jgi:4-amino-4-deoxy-L-arabinose transferase-like glycosyltransferase
VRRAPEVIALVALAVGLRLYRIAEYTTFQGDQGVDALAARRLLVDHVLPVEGPATSAGGVHLGPVYYYLLAVPMQLVWLDPLADAVFMAALGALAVGLLYVLARLWFGRLAAVVAATVLALSPAAIEASRSAWNPAPAPFFVLLALLGLEGFRRQHDGRWLVLVGGALSCVIQFHYFALGLVVVVAAFAARLVRRAATWRVAGWALLGVGLGGALLAPLVVHEISSGFPNLHAAIGLLGAAGGQEQPQADSLPRRLYAVLTPSLVGGFLTAGVEPLAVVMTLALAAGLGIGLANAHTRYACAVLASVLAALMLQTAGYRGPIQQHYLLAYAPIACLALAAAVGVWPRWRGVQVVGGVGLLALLVVNVAAAPFGQPGNQLARSEAVARRIDAAAGGGSFGLWLVADADSDGAYRFQLERLGHPPVRPDEALPRQLFVVCQATLCDIGDVRTAAGPEWTASRLDLQDQVDDVRITRLVLPE